VPIALAQAGHLDNFDGAEVVFTGPALGRNRNVIWDPNDATCRNNYCHDPGEAGNAAPTWNAVSGPLRCDGCHTMPPPPPHVTFTQCSFCHSDVGPDQTIIDRSRHVNGTVDF
jgi:predicted CxxxxCH...CXXCH cytochrome family protein